MEFLRNISIKIQTKLFTPPRNWDFRQTSTFAFRILIRLIEYSTYHTLLRHLQYPITSPTIPYYVTYHTLIPYYVTYHTLLRHLPHHITSPTIPYYVTYHTLLLPIPFQINMCSQDRQNSYPFLLTLTHHHTLGKASECSFKIFISGRFLAFLNCKNKIFGAVIIFSSLQKCQ